MCLENGRYGAFFGHKSTFTNFSLNLSLNFPEIVIGERHLKVVKGNLLNFVKKILVMLQLAEMGHF